MYHFYLNEEERGVWEWDVFTRLARYLNENHISLETRNASSFVIWKGWLRRERIEIHHNLALLQHLSTRRYWVVDGNDWVTPFGIDIPAFARDPRCVAVLKCQYERGPYAVPPLTKIRPWTYFETWAVEFQQHLDEYRRIPGTRTPLFFRGNVSWGQRQPILELLARRRLVNRDYAGWVSYDAHARELAEHKVGLSLEGMGNVCHREVEAFGLGTPVLMPRLRNDLHEKLIPDHHYISIDVDAREDPPDRIADKIQRRYEEVVGDQPYLDRIAANAMAWYDRNVRMPASLELAARLMGLA